MFPNSQLGFFQSFNTLLISFQRDAWLFPDNTIDPTSDIQNNVWFALKPLWYQLNSSGVLVIRGDSSFGSNFYYTAGNATIVKNNSKEQYVCITNGNVAWMDTLCSDSTKTTNATNTLLTFLSTTGFSGVELDFEGFGTWTAGQYTNYKTFLTSLGNSLHTNGYKLMVDVPPIWNNTTSSTSNEWTSRNSQGYYQLKYEDFNSLPVDYIVPLAYDYQFDEGAGTPNSPMQWMADIATWAKQKITNKNSIIIGVPSAGYSGITGGFTTTGQTYNALSLVTGFGSAARNSASGELIWANGGSSYGAIDNVTIDNKRQFLKAVNLYRFSLWHVGNNRYSPNLI